MKPRELMLALITCAIALYAVTFILFKPRFEELKLRRREIAGLESQILAARDTVSRKAEWEKKLGDLQKSIRPLPADQPAANYLARLINDLSSRNGVNLTDRKPGEEKASGGLHVLPITCRWDSATTKSACQMLVDFINSDVIMDVVELMIVSKGQDSIKGTFTVNCVYTQ